MVCAVKQQQQALVLCLAGGLLWVVGLSKEGKIHYVCSLFFTRGSNDLKGILGHMDVN